MAYALPLFAGYVLVKTLFSLFSVKLNKVSTIKIPMIDPDGDTVRCSYAAFVERGHLTRPPGIKVLNEVCKLEL